MWWWRGAEKSERGEMSGEKMRDVKAEGEKERVFFCAALQREEETERDGEDRSHVRREERRR